LSSENYSTQLKEIEDLNKWKDIKDLKTVWMATVRKFIYKFNAIPITIPTEEMNKLILKQS
jgi:hypothetical protein